MTDIPEMYLAEAAKRSGFDSWRDALNAASSVAIHCIDVHARTLQELGWTPPIDESRMAKARVVAAAVVGSVGMEMCAALIRDGDLRPSEKAAIQAAYDALGED